MIAAALDHLWQSTLFVGVVGLLTLMLRRNDARVRHALWLAASVKFFIPAAILVAIGTRLSPSVPFTKPGSAAQLLEHAGTAIVTPARFAHFRSLGMPVGPHASVETLLVALWALGAVTIATVWLSRWLRIRQLLREARPFELASPVSIRCCKSTIEPALVGILRPTVLLPEGLTERLSPQELQAVLAHEISHFRRRDNLTAAIHMIAEAAFWFFPVTWWLGARLVAERERACDEAVLASGIEAEVYAEGILKVCKFYVHLPATCVAGVSGADLKRRVELIMTGYQAHPLNSLRKAAIAVTGVLFITVPLGIGTLAAKSVATTDDVLAASAAPTPAQIAERRYEQARPRTAIPFNPGEFDKYVGYYQFAPSTLMHVTRHGDHYLTQLPGQWQMEFYPDSPTEFFAKTISAQINFVRNSAGQTIGLVIHQNGLEQAAKMVEDRVATEAEARLAARIAANVQSPGTQAAVRHQIDALENGQPDYSAMAPALAKLARDEVLEAQSMFKRPGALQSLVFKGISADGMDVYDATFANGQLEFRIAPLARDGKVTGFGMRSLP